MSGKDAKKNAEVAKEAGNKAFSAKNFALAVTKFTQAIELDPSNEAYYSNRAAAYTKLEQHDLAIEDGKKCLELAPTWGKGFSRLGAAYVAKGEFAKAVGIYAQGIAHDPENEGLTEGLQVAQKKLSQQKKKSEKKKAKKEAEVESKTEKKGEVVIGIDLGTTYSCVGVWEGDGVKIITNSHGSKTTPSYVGFKKNGEILVGTAAKASAIQRPVNTIFDVKRLIGLRFTDPGVATDIGRFPFKVLRGDDDKLLIKLQDMEEGVKDTYAPEEISALVLGEMKAVAEAYLKHPVNKAVITVPAYFNDSQRAATKAAGAIAGLEVLRIINEPTAAALSYGLDNVAKDKVGATNVCIFDLGGGTFDVSILSIEGGIFTVRSTGGDTRLGGEDFDHKISDWLMEEVEKAGFGDAKTNDRALRRLRTAAEKAKKDLSQGQNSDIVLDNLMDEKTFQVTLSRTKFEALNSGMFNACLDTVKRVLKDAKLNTKDIHEIVLIGGSTRIPKIQKMLQTFFDGRALCKSVNPDEAVAYGAAVQGAILSGTRNARTDDVLLMDVTPLSLGIETTGRVMSVIIPRNSTIPCIKTQTYTTEQNFQTQVDIAVYEGERMQTEHNHLLGEVTISGIEKAKKGEPQVDVTFSIDSNGILDVKAKDRKTGAEAKIQIANSGRSGDAEVKQMIEDAEKNRRLDQERMKRVEYRHELENLVMEALETADSIEKKQSKLAAVIRKAAEQEQEFLDGTGENVPASEYIKRRRALERRIQGKQADQ